MAATNSKLLWFAAQFEALYNGRPWYGTPLLELVKPVTPAKAFWQPKKNAHSIAQLISHIIYWRQPLIKRLSGDLDYTPSVQSEDNWKINEQLRKKGWKSLLQSLEESQHLLVTLLTNHKDSLLKKKYSDNLTYQELINGILQHDLYHTGQVAYLKNIYQRKKK